MPQHFIKNGVYFETITDVPAPQGAVAVSQRPSPDHQPDGNGGWVYVAPQSEPIEQQRLRWGLTRRQVIIGMVAEGLISDAEGLALAQNGTPPAAVEAIIQAMSTPLQRSAARITLASFTVAYRIDPMTQVFQAAGGLSDAQMDAFFQGYTNV